MTDPITIAARAAAQCLVADYGPRLPDEVEAALSTRGTARRPDQFIDPVSVGSLIVAIATLAWTVYSDLNKKTPETVIKQIRCELREYDGPGTGDADHITTIVVGEIVRAAQNPRKPFL